MYNEKTNNKDKQVSSIVTVENELFYLIVKNYLQVIFFKAFFKLKINFDYYTMSQAVSKTIKNFL